ncbi:MAG: ASCH domain-containing protein [Treponema sp.]|nr:ASCH domain-containing protein [Treponema sp.]
MTANDYWIDFISKKGLDPDSLYHGELGFGLDRDDTIYMTELVLSGRKTALFSSLLAMNIDMNTVSKPGNYFVINDQDNNPCGVIRMKNVSIIAFKDITWSIAIKDGQDSSIEQWRQRMIEFFEDEAEVMGYEFSPDMPVVIEEFELLH